jgi:hypothetical protein
MKQQIVKIDERIYCVKKPLPDEVIRSYRTFMGIAVEYIGEKETNLYKFYIFKLLGDKH